MQSQYYSGASLEGKVAIVTGASAGFGEAISWRLAELGMKLVLVARREERLRALADALKAKHGTQTHVVPLDVRDTAACEAFVGNLPEEFKQVYLLINNAGLALGTDPAQNNNIADMRTMLETNVLSAMALTKSALQVMLPADSGHIINIGSTAGHEAYPGGSGYCASKFALKAFTDVTRHDLVNSSIRITLISPGAAETEFSLVRFKGDADKAKEVYKGMAKMVAADIADQVVYAATRPTHVQINDIIVTCVHQSGAHYKARPLQDK